jgi:hypothetical protein
MFILLVSADQMMNENGYFKLGQVDSGAHTWAATKTKKAVRLYRFLHLKEKIFLSTKMEGIEVDC